MRRQQFLFNPENPKKSFDVYINKNPDDTIPIKYKTLDDVKQTIEKLEKLFKTNEYPHKRIWQVAMIMKVRLEVIKKYHNTPQISQRTKLAQRYLKFLSNRTKLKETDRKQTVFKV